MSIDFDSFFRNRIEALLIQASWVGAVQSLVGLKAVSQVWNGRAEWYLWLDGAPGVYGLSFADGESSRLDGRLVHEGFFTVKCYPYREHPGFADYSPDERRLIQSDLFDATNTPRFEALDQIPDALFGIGCLSLVLDHCSSLGLLAFESLDALKVFQEEDSDPSGAGDPKRSPGAIREVRGWAVGWPLFDCLVGLYANACKRAPVFWGATRGPGFECLVHSRQDSFCRSSPATSKLAVSIGFADQDGMIGALEEFWRSRLEPEEEVLTAAQLSSRPDGPPEHRVAGPYRLNPCWWTIAGANFKSELNTACGCADGHCCHSH